MYRRCDKDCNPTSPQPGSVVVQDVFGNSFRNWCVDYVGTDKDCAPDGTTGCAPNPPVLWTRHLYDNSDGTTSPFNEPPLNPLGGGLLTDVILNPDGTIANLFLALDEDRDLIVVTDGVQQAVQLENSTTVLPTVAYNHNNP